MAKKEKLNPRKELMGKLKNMNAVELTAFVSDKKKTLLEERFNRLAQKLTKVGTYRRVRRDIARALTVMGQQQQVKE